MLGAHTIHPRSSLASTPLGGTLHRRTAGVPLATRREGVGTMRRAYHEALEILLGSWVTEKRSIHHEKETEHGTGAGTAI